MPLIPSAAELLQEALSKAGRNKDLNSIHAETYLLMLQYRERYYEGKVDDFLGKPGLKLEDETRRRLRRAMLEPVRIEDTEYSNFMEEASRRISQTFQVISGRLAELVVEHGLNDAGLIEEMHYMKNVERTDIMLYYPDSRDIKKRHRVEVKNVHLRERGVRGLGFDGDTMLGFFVDADEFSPSTIQIIDDFCGRRSGYCYMPPSTLSDIPKPGVRFRPNTRFVSDALEFVKNGKIPDT